MFLSIIEYTLEIIIVIILGCFQISAFEWKSQWRYMDLEWKRSDLKIRGKRGKGKDIKERKVRPFPVENCLNLLCNSQPRYKSPTIPNPLLKNKWLFPGSLPENKWLFLRRFLENELLLIRHKHLLIFVFIYFQKDC